MKFERAKKRVTELKSFYNHILIFVLINTIVYVSWFFWLPHTDFFDIDDPGFLRWTKFNLITFPIGWGIGLLFHGLNAYGKLDFFKKWEEKKIDELMEQDEHKV